MAGDRKHVIALGLRPIQEGGPVGRVPIPRKKSIAHVEAPELNMSSALETKPERIRLVLAEHSGNIAGNAFEVPASSRLSVRETRTVCPMADLVGHESYLPCIGSIVKSPEIHGGRI